MTGTGHCLCGAVRFTAAHLPSGYGVCHCEMCRRWTGSALYGVTVTEADMTVEGSDAVRTYRSSDWATRSWCDHCGSTLWYRITAEGPHKGDYEIALGLFDDASGLSLRREIFIDRKPDSYALAGDHPRLTQAEVLAQYAAPSEGGPNDTV